MTTKHKIKQRLALFLMVHVLFLPGLTGCADRAPAGPVSCTGFAFDTVVSITIYDASKAHVLDGCLALCERYEGLFSATIEGSEIWNINHAGGMPVSISYETVELIQAALSYCDSTQGVLDLTLRPVAAEWDIAGQKEQASLSDGYAYYIPSDETLAELLAHVAYQNVVITDGNGCSVSLQDPLSKDESYYVTLTDDRSAVDLGFIAKGYIADCLKSYLLSEGIESAIISLGGNILLIGSKPDDAPYHVGIQKPFGYSGETITTIEAKDVSVVSSGCYERYFIPDKTEKDGTIYHHIFDTATGAPVQNDLLGVTIISDSSLQGDALSTYCYILGLDRGLEYIQSLDNVDAIFITKDYEIIYA